MTDHTDSQPTPADTYLQPQPFPWRSLLLLVCTLAAVAGGYYVGGGVGAVLGVGIGAAVASPWRPRERA